MHFDLQTGNTMGNVAMLLNHGCTCLVAGNTQDAQMAHAEGVRQQSRMTEEMYHAVHQ